MPRRLNLARIVKQTDTNVYIQVGNNQYRVNRHDWEIFERWFRRHTHLSPLTAFAVSVGHAEGLSRDSIRRYERELRRFYRDRRHEEIRDNVLGKYIRRSIAKHSPYTPIFVICAGVIVQTAKGYYVDLYYVSLISRERYGTWRKFIREFRPLTITIKTRFEEFEYCTDIIKKGTRIRSKIDEQIRRYLSQHIDQKTKGGSARYWVYYAVPRVVFFHDIGGETTTEFRDSVCEKCLEVLKLTILWAYQQGMRPIEIMHYKDLYELFKDKARKLAIEVCRMNGYSILECNQKYPKNPQ